MQGQGDVIREALERAVVEAEDEVPGDPLAVSARLLELPAPHPLRTVLGSGHDFRRPGRLDHFADGVADLGQALVVEGVLGEGASSFGLPKRVSLSDLNSTTAVPTGS